MSVYVIFGFDMETDIGSYLKTYHGVREGTEILLRILDTYKIRSTFFFTGEAAEKNPDVVKKIAEMGHEIGCHSLKHETVGDAAFNMPNDNPILEEEVENRLQLNKRIVQKASGRKPVSFRAPRLWQGQAQILALEKMGFIADASYSVSTHKERIAPYHPSSQNWLKKGELKLLEIPNFAFIDTDYNFDNFFCGNDQWPLLRLLGADFIIEHSRGFIDRQTEESGKAVLLFYLHPWEFVPMPEKYDYDEGTFFFKPELYENCGEEMEKEFVRFINRATKNGYEFVSVKELTESWHS